MGRQPVSVHTLAIPPPITLLFHVFPSRCDLEAACKLSIDRSMFFYFLLVDPHPFII